MDMRIDGNVRYMEKDGERKVVCAYCSYAISKDGRNYVDDLACYEGPVSMAGPQVFSDASVYVDAETIFLQYCCPNCFTAFFTEVVPKGDEVRPL